MPKAAAMDLGGYGIRVNSIHPSLVDTPISDKTPIKVLAAVQTTANAMTLCRSGLPQEIAELIAFLASDKSSDCTDITFSTDGGWTAAERQ